MRTLPASTCTAAAREHQRPAGRAHQRPALRACPLPEPTAQRATHRRDLAAHRPISRSNVCAPACPCSAAAPAPPLLLERHAQCARSSRTLHCVCPPCITYTTCRATCATSVPHCVRPALPPHGVALHGAAFACARPCACLRPGPHATAPPPSLRNRSASNIAGSVVSRST